MCLNLNQKHKSNFIISKPAKIYDRGSRIQRANFKAEGCSYITKLKIFHTWTVFCTFQNNFLKHQGESIKTETSYRKHFNDASDTATAWVVFDITRCIWSSVLLIDETPPWSSLKQI